MTTPSETLLLDGVAQAVASDLTGVERASTQRYGMAECSSNDSDDASFTTAYLIVVNSLTETLHREVARARGVLVDGADGHQRAEVSAAMWAMIRVALAASLLSSSQQQFVLHALRSRLRARWKEDLCAADGRHWPIEERAAFYLQQIDPQDPVTTAARIVEILLDAAEVPTAQRELHTRVIGGLIAHRIVSDVWLFNSWESEGKLPPSRPKSV